MTTDIKADIKNGTIKHSLKILPKYFNEVQAKRKNFELRLNDRDFKAGDIFVLREFDNGAYTGRYFIGSISYVLKNCEEYGLKDGYCIFGF